jgi:hypothetical protein
MDVLTTPPLRLHDWLAIVESEYLSSFVPAGGAAVKFAILDGDSVAAAADGLLRLGRSNGLLTVGIDAARTRIHMMHELFFAIARDLPWDSLLQRYLEELFGENAYPWPRPGEVMTIPDLAAAFSVAQNLLSRHVDRWLTADLWDDPRLAQDFRAGILALCLARLNTDGVEAADPVLRWLRGEKVPAALLRAFDISVRVSRASARPMLTSLCHFLRKAGAAGLLIVLDARTLSRAAAMEGSLKYSPAALMDTYEVLREIIDDAEHLPGLCVIVLADSALVSGDPRRALAQYAALQMRIWPDVRPGDRQNPVAPLVWLTA